MTNTNMNKTEGFLDKAKKFVKKHKVELAIGGGLVAAYFITRKPKTVAQAVQNLPSPTVIDPEKIAPVVETTIDVATDISNVAAPVVETVVEAVPEVVETVASVM